MKIEILGTVQDGGVPHLGCECDVCEAAREDPSKQRYNASILLKENSDSDSIRYLIDATPDVRYQLHGEYLDGVFISHGHLGHINGLLHFGEEGRDAEMIPVYVSDKAKEYISKNDPFRILIDKNNIDLITFNDGDSQSIQGANLQAIEVIHTGVNTDTLAFMIRGENKNVFYMSDIHEWTEETLGLVKEADIAIIDGTFWDKEEIDRYHEVPHPVIKETMHKTENWDTEIIFTHLNHTNPALRPNTEERKELEERGFKIAERGMELEI